MKYLYALLLLPTLSLAPTAPLHVHDQLVRQRLIEIRSMKGRISRVKAYDDLVDNITRPSPLIREQVAADPPESELATGADRPRLAAADARRLKELADDIAAIVKYSKDVEFEFRDREKQRLLKGVEDSLRRFQEWPISKQAHRLVREHGTDLGQGFYMLYVGQRPVPNAIIDQDDFYYALIYDGERKWKIAQLSWELKDLLGETISQSSGKFTPEELTGKVHLLNTTTSLLHREQRAHVKDARDGEVVRVKKARIVWDEE